MKALVEKFWLQHPYNDVLAWGGKEVVERSTVLGNADLMYCVAGQWEQAFTC